MLNFAGNKAYINQNKYSNVNTIRSSKTSLGSMPIVKLKKEKYQLQKSEISRLILFIQIMNLKEKKCA